MTERERWIVYPLLFLALGAALRDKLVERTTTKSIVCQELSIVDEEVTGQLSQRTLVRIGGTKPKPGEKSMGTFQINGDVELVDGDLTENSPARLLVKLGRTDPPPNVPATGYAYVDGAVHSRQYTVQGIPLVPLQITPGVPMPNASQAMPRPGPKVPNTNAPNAKSPSQPPADDAKKGDGAAQPPSPAGEGATPAK